MNPAVVSVAEVTEIVCLSSMPVPSSNIVIPSLNIMNGDVL
jgi:hypothetical protein